MAGDPAQSVKCADQRLRPAVDLLQREASRLVEAAGGEDAATTFHRLTVLAYSTAGLPLPPAPSLAPDRWRPPRLTKAWFG